MKSNQPKATTEQVVVWLDWTGDYSPAKLNKQCGLICWRISTVTRKKLINLYPSGELIAERVTWKSRTEHPDCWLIPIRPPADDSNICEPLILEINRQAEVACAEST